MCIDFCCALNPYIFLQCRTLDYGIGGHRSICHRPSSHVISITSNPPCKTIDNLCELHGNQWICRSSTFVGLTWGNEHKQMKNKLFMQIIIYPWRTINTTFGQTKHLLTLEMKNMCHERKPKGTICNG